MIKKIRFYIATIIVLLAGYFLACEKQENTIDDIPIDTTIIDPKLNTRTVNDGFYNFVFIFYNYKGQSGQSLFLQDAAHSRAALMHWLSTFEPQYHIDTNLVTVTIKATNQNLKCNDNNLSINEGVSCKWSLAYSIAFDVADGEFSVDRIGIFGNGKGSGGSDGDRAFYAGMGNHTNQWCDFNLAAFHGKMWHELLHTYDINHTDSPCNKAAGTYTTNGGCAMVYCPILPYHQQLIYNDYILATN